MAQLRISYKRKPVLIRTLGIATSAATIGVMGAGASQAQDFVTRPGDLYTQPGDIRAEQSKPGMHDKKIVPVFTKRIQALREQIDLAANRGWISSDQASAFRSELSTLESRDQALLKESGQTEWDSMERSVGKLHTDLHQAMTGRSPASSSTAPPDTTDGTASSPSPPAPTSPVLDPIFSSSYSSENPTPVSSPTTTTVNEIHDIESKPKVTPGKAASAGQPASAAGLMKTLKPLRPKK